MFSQRSFNGQQLKEARIYRGMTLEQLGKDLDVSKQMISKFEQGLSVPNPEQVFSLIQVLKFPREHFFSTDKLNYDYGNSYFRALLSTTKRDKQMQLAKIENIATLRSFLELNIEFPELDLPDLSLHNGIEEKAKELRKFWNLGNEPISNVVELLESKGIVMTDLTFSDEKIDAFSQRVRVNDGDNQFIKTHYIIVLGNNKKSYYRRQFDAVHELAHLLLHEFIDDVEDLTHEEYKRIERESDEFSGCFLLPAKGFIKDIEANPTSLSTYRDIKMKWKVSIASMIVRARQLNVVNQDQYMNLFKSLSRNKWRKEEPLDKVTPQVHPEAFSEAFDLLFSERVYTTESFLKSFSNWSGKYLNYSEIEELLSLEKDFFAKYLSSKSKVRLLRKRNEAEEI